MSDQNNTKSSDKAGVVLPPIPDKIYFTIGEVGRLCKVKPHVLRYWEQEFSQLAPSKRRGNRRYYQHKDVLLVRRIRRLLYDEGYTIEGARQQLHGIVPKKEGQNPSLIKATKVAIQKLENIARNLRS